MCGIGGFYGFGGYRLETIYEVYGVRVLVDMLEERGRDAFGWLIKSGNEITVSKYSERASTILDIIDEFVGLYELLHGVDTVLMHTRLATEGSPEVYVNNHPFVIPISSTPSKATLVGAHNGVYWGYKEKEKNGEPETDSYYMLKRIAKSLEGAKDVDTVVERLEEELSIIDHFASFAIWLYLPRFDVLVIARDNDRPLSYIDTKDFVIFASESRMLKNVAKLFDFKPKNVRELRAGAIVAFTRDGEKVIGQFDVASTTYSSYRGYGNGYSESGEYDPEEYTRWLYELYRDYDWR